MRYYVTWKVEGRYTSCIDADSLEEAKEKAEEDFADANLNEMEDIWSCDTRQISVQDDGGNIIWED